MILPVIKGKILQVVIISVLVCSSLALISKVGTQGGMSVIPALAAIAAVSWVVFSGEKWWIVTPVAIAFGGTLLVEYKFYAHEMALVLCILALFPVIALRRPTLQARPSLPGVAYVLLILFAVNWVRSLYGLDADVDFGDIGSLSRSYLHGVWALLFGILFYRYGILKPALILRLLYGTFFLRAVLGGLAVFFQDVLPIPKMGFILSGMTLGLGDYRITGIQLGMLAFIHSQLSLRPSVKTFHYLVLLVSVIIAALGGGRVSVVMICVIPLIFAFLRRQYSLVAMSAAMVLILVVALNQYPDILYRLPEGMRRSLSILVSESSTRWLDWHEFNQLSNMWHQKLGELGFARWTESPVTVLCGNHVEPFNELFNAYSATWEMKAEVAAKMGLYEAGLWTVLGLLGMVGLYAYAALFIFLLKNPFVELQRNGIISPTQGLFFIALVGVFLWAGFSWIAGGFPSYELMMAFLAKAAYDDTTRGIELDKDSL